nr:hypothetical protein [Mycoplasmopsis bovis]
MKNEWKMKSQDFLKNQEKSKVNLTLPNWKRIANKKCFTLNNLRRL